MPFWTKNHSEDATLRDPKRKFRFIVNFDGISGENATAWYAKAASKPSFQIGAAEHKYLNHTFFYPGSVTWQDVSITLVDPVDPDVAATFSDIVVQAGYTPPPNVTEWATMSKAKASTALGAVTITQIDSEGATLEKWTLYNSWLSEVKYGDLEYGGDDLTEVALTLKYDWAMLKTENTDGSALKTSGGSDFFKI
jgi:hypothetical protein